MNWLIGRIKWIMVALALGGPVVSYLGFDKAAEIKLFQEEGITATASLDSMMEKSGRRSGRSYEVDISWTDEAGNPRSATGVDIDSGYAQNLFEGDMLITDTVDIIYLADEAEKNPHVLGSLEGEAETADFMKLGGIGGGIAGAIGVLIMFLMGRKKKPVLA